jgi:cytochrome c-type biogenesis protein
MLTSIGFAFLAGTLSILSPCVLPLLPIVLGSAASQGKFGPAALGAGVVVSFVTVGLFVAVVGFSIGLDGGLFKSIAALVLLFIGLVLLFPPLQARFTNLARPLSDWGNNTLGNLAPAGVLGQFAIGVLLGMVWSPCVGPTLGAASLLAAQGKDLTHVAITMTAFAVGVGVPLVIIGLLSRTVYHRSRRNFSMAGRGLKVVLGLALILLGSLIFSGYDRLVEAALVDASPEWLTALTTRF